MHGIPVASNQASAICGWGKVILWLVQTRFWSSNDNGDMKTNLERYRQAGTACPANARQGAPTPQALVGIPAKARAFTIIEMVGTVCILAILIALIIPKIFAAIDQARINQSTSFIHAARTATVCYYAKYGYWGGTNGVKITTQYPSGLPAADWGKDVLVKNELLDPNPGPFVGEPFHIRIFPVNANASASPSDNNADNGAYKLEFTNPRANDVYLGGGVVEAVIENVALEDAYSLSVAIDGVNGSINTTSHVDSRGAVKYNFGSAGHGTVFVYLVHR
jgi:type II secretory pathway pseudopilin PulG